MTPQTTAQSAQASALALAALMAQSQTLYGALSNWLTDYSQNTWDTYWSQMPTCSVNADGSLGPIDVTAGTGTVAVTLSSALLTFSASQTGLAGKWITINGDATNGLYLVSSGATTVWTLSANYNGSTASAAGWNTSTPNSAHPIFAPYLLLSRNSLITAKTALSTLQTVFSQAAGTVTMPNQTILQTAAILAPGTL